MNKREIGNYYERMAGRYLEEQGYKILAYNVSCRTGEIDIVAKDGIYLVFVEVKYRKDAEKGDPFEAVTYAKQKTISQCAFYYLNKHRLLDVPMRFDVVGILGDEIQVVKNAFEFVI